MASNAAMKEQLKKKNLEIKLLNQRLEEINSTPDERQQEFDELQEENITLKGLLDKPVAAAKQDINLFLKDNPNYRNDSLCGNCNPIVEKMRVDNSIPYLDRQGLAPLNRDEIEVHIRKRFPGANTVGLSRGELKQLIASLESDYGNARHVVLNEEG